MIQLTSSTRVSMATVVSPRCTIIASTRLPCKLAGPRLPLCPEKVGTDVRCTGRPGMVSCDRPCPTLDSGGLCVRLDGYLQTSRSPKGGESGSGPLAAFVQYVTMVNLPQSWLGDGREPLSEAVHKRGPGSSFRRPSEEGRCSPDNVPFVDLWFTNHS